jgi:tetratricopeptide (TPR) repeat protein
MTKKIKENVKKALDYSDKNMEFSALKYWELAFELEPNAYRQLMYADQLRLCGMCEHAEKIFSSIDLEQIPQHFRHFYFSKKGQLFADIGKFAEARTMFKLWVDHDPKSTVPYVFLASVLREEKFNEDAIMILTEALDKEGDIDEVCYNLATRMAIKGDFSSALSLINKCLQLDENYPNAANFKKDMEEVVKLKNPHESISGEDNTDLSDLALPSASI